MKPHLSTVPEVGTIHPSERLKNREGQIQLAKEIGPVMCAIFEKIASAFDSHSRLDLPNGKALAYYSHDSFGVIYRCGAQLKISIPFEFIEAIDEGTVEKIDQMIRNWTFLLNGLDIPPQLWCDNPHYDINKPLTDVPQKTHDALTGEAGRGSKGERLVKKLLPPRVPRNISEDISERGVPKLQQTELVKFPHLFIKKRENS